MGGPADHRFGVIRHQAEELRRRYLPFYSGHAETAEIFNYRVSPASITATGTPEGTEPAFSSIYEGNMGRDEPWSVSPCSISP